MSQKKHAVKETNIQSLDPHSRAEWIVVGDASRFLIYERDRKQPLALLKSFANPTAHLKGSDLETDQPGRSFSSANPSHGGQHTGALRHSYSSEQDPKTHVLESFVGEVCNFLQKGRNSNAFGNMILIAEDRLVGRLRASLDKTTSSLISDVFPKDLAWLSGAGLEERILSLLEPPE